ncbi:TonB-dependent receptor [Marivirga tractuosa]|uniref:TonB-dependent receptor n=1 Tax=Marivirga tractuosa TaxID=1006 RepID=UPI0035D0D109
MNCKVILQRYNAKKYLVFLALWICIVLIPLELTAQINTISGFIKDRSTGELIIGATVYDKESGNFSASNQYGFYTLEINNSDSVLLQINHSAYKYLDTLISSPKGSRRVNFHLKPKGFLNEVVVYSKNDFNAHNLYGVNLMSLESRTINQLPALGGEPDVLRSIQFLPGVTATSEGSSDFSVRGGSNFENLIMLDNVPLYYVNHLGGFVSIFNSDAINNFDLFKGGFPAKYGNRLSSVLDVNTLEGDRQTQKGKAKIGLISSSVSYQGPIKNEKTSFFISGRRFMYDLIMRPLSKLLFDGTSFGYSFYDLNAKINHDWNENNKFYLSIYAGDDGNIIKNESENNISNNYQKWGNKFVSMRWNHIYSPKLFSNFTLAFLNYRFTNGIKYVDNNPKILNESISTSRINDILLKLDYEYFLKTNLSLNFGLQQTYHFYLPNQLSEFKSENSNVVIDSNYLRSSIRAYESNFYAHVDWGLYKKITISPGLRLGILAVENKAYLLPEPRFNMIFKANEGNVFSFAYALMHQNIHLLSSTGLTAPINIWLPSSENIRPSQSQQLNVGYVKNFRSQEFKISGMLYYKKYSNLVMPRQEIGLLFETQPNFIEENINVGRGRAYGSELVFEVNKPKYQAWTTYTLSKSVRQFNEINGGEEFPFQFDRRHAIDLVVVFKVKEGVNFSATWNYTSGAPITLPVGKYQVPHDNNPNFMNNILIYEDVNNFRMGDYHRLDIGINFIKQKRKGERIWNISIFNIYNRKNPYFYFLERNDIEGQLSLKQQSLFPFLPSFSYTFSF